MPPITPTVSPQLLATQAAAAISPTAVRTSTDVALQNQTTVTPAVDEYTLLSRDYDLKTDPRYQFTLAEDDFHAYLAGHNPLLKHIETAPIGSFAEFKEELASTRWSWGATSLGISAFGIYTGAVAFLSTQLLYITVTNTPLMMSPFTVGTMGAALGLGTVWSFLFGTSVLSGLERKQVAKHFDKYFREFIHANPKNLKSYLTWLKEQCEGDQVSFKKQREDLQMNLNDLKARHAKRVDHPDKESMVQSLADIITDTQNKLTRIETQVLPLFIPALEKIATLIRETEDVIEEQETIAIIRGKQGESAQVQSMEREFQARLTRLTESAGEITHDAHAAHAAKNEVESL